jgi:predicted outer membrane protein
MTMSRRSAVAALPGLVALTLAACSRQQTATAPASDGNVTPADLEFITNSFNIIEFDRQACILAPTRSKNPEVIALAAHLLSDANAFRDRLKPLAEAQGVRPPNTLRTDLRVRLGYLTRLPGVGFDQQFISDQIFSHEEVLQRQQEMRTTEGVSPQFRQLADAGEAIVEANLEKLRALQRKLMMNTH